MATIQKTPEELKADDDFKKDIGIPDFPEKEIDTVRQEMVRAIQTFDHINLNTSPKRYLFMFSDADLQSFKTKIETLYNNVLAEITRRLGGK